MTAAIRTSDQSKVARFRAPAVSKTTDRLLRQQAALAEFGSFAFGEADLQKILTQAVRICAASLDVPFAKVCRYRVEENDLLVVAGCGWQAGVVGHVVSAADVTSTQGRAFVGGEPVILKDIAKSTGYELPPFYAEHGIVATVDVLIKGRGGAWGVLEVDSTAARKFDRYDIVFLTGFANVLAEAAATAEQIVNLRAVVQQTQSLLAQKERLLTERRESERMLRDLQAELLRVARLNMMGQMTAAIAHELNQPLSAIGNYLAAAKRTLKSAEPDAMAGLPAIVGKAADQTKRAGDIIKNLREFVEKRESAHSSEDIAVIVRRSLALATYGALDEKVDVTLNLDETLPPVAIDAVQVQQVLTNLICNSVEAMRPLDRRNLLIVTERGEAGFANVTVQDTGPGLPTDVREHLFEPFVTTKDSGMGLGLNICEVLIKANGGHLSLVEGLSEGTGFRFSLPFAKAA
ncbi:MAG: ATP-binding protein [Rhizomicrobium sp.]